MRLEAPRAQSLGGLGFARAGEHESRKVGAALLLPRNGLQDGILHWESIATQIIDTLDSAGRDDLVPHLKAVINNAHDVYRRLLNPRLQHHQFRNMLTVNGKLPPEKAGLLQSFEQKMYGVLGEPLPANIDDYYKDAIKEWESEFKKQAIKKAAAAGAAARTGGKTRPFPTGTTRAGASTATPAPRSTKSVGAAPRRA